MPLLEDGQIFERYRIIRWLGNGVAGESYEAEDRILQRKAALKIIHPWSPLPDSARRQFFRDMQGISTLKHPYLATILDYGEGEGHMYVARRYVSSGSLLSPNGRLWFQPPLPVANAFAYANQLAKVLHYIHKLGYAHGALTFANVLVLRGPNIEQEADYAPFLLSDIGLAHFIRRFGSPQIEALPVSAAPEQMGKRVISASDQFALAVLLYFWLAGRPPFLGTPDEVERLKLTQKITPLSTLNPEVTEEHDALISRALTAYPEERYPSITAFTEALLTSLTAPKQPQPTPTDQCPKQPETLRAILAQARLIPSTAPELTAPYKDSGSEQPPLDQTQTNDASLPTLQPCPSQQELSVLTEHTNKAACASALQDTSPTCPQMAPIKPDAATSQPAEASPQDVAQPAITNTLLSDEVASPTDEPARQELSTSVPRLLISSPYAKSPFEFLLTREATNVGRASANDLLLNDDNLTSRYHALFKRIETRVLVFDKHSNNGVFVNGQRIEAERDCELADGDHISIGSYELIYRAARPKHTTQLI